MAQVYMYYQNLHYIWGLVVNCHKVEGTRELSLCSHKAEYGKKNSGRNVNWWEVRNSLRWLIHCWKAVIQSKACTKLFLSQLSVCIVKM
ncbi:hypothetical protein C5167_044382 [Papaver somniferum]|uniref:Uncharacterized protein n=1 Tax=Papaver somniferum TaxID=3469 RepID=A0A4Y7L8G4_PAPSO|nr:hypothetical protein C5167_044382 [Papaver somniferum]